MFEVALSSRWVVCSLGCEMKNLLVAKNKNSSHHGFHQIGRQCERPPVPAATDIDREHHEENHKWDGIFVFDLHIAGVQVGLNQNACVDALRDAVDQD